MIYIFFFGERLSNEDMTKFIKSIRESKIHQISELYETILIRQKIHIREIWIK